MTRVVVYTIPGQCPLCDEAKDLLRAEGVAFTEVDIRADRELLRAYRLEIPVVMIDGQKEFVGHVDAARLRRIL